MSFQKVSSTDFQNKAGQYIDAAAKQPIFITKRSRTIRVLLDIEEYERLKQYDTRKTLYPHELGDDMVAELEKGYQGKETPELDHLLK